MKRLSLSQPIVSLSKLGVVDLGDDVLGKQVTGNGANFEGPVLGDITAGDELDVCRQGKRTCLLSPT